MKRTFVASLIVCFCFFLLLTLLLSPTSGRASDGSNLLHIPGFEESTDHWLSGPSGAAFVVTDTLKYVHGTWAASLNRTDGVTGQIYISQDVDVGGAGSTKYAYLRENALDCIDAHCYNGVDKAEKTPKIMSETQEETSSRGRGQVEQSSGLLRGFIELLR